MKVLLDTCTVAEIRKTRPVEAVVEAVRAIPDEQLFLSVLTVGEIAKGIALLAAGKKRRELTAWLRGLEEDYSDRLLPVDRHTATIWGEVTAKAAKGGPASDTELLVNAARRYAWNHLRRPAPEAATATHVQRSADLIRAIGHVPQEVPQ